MADQPMDLQASLALADEVSPDPARAHAALVCLRDAVAARVLTCAYCGHEYPQDTPAAGDQVLTDHIGACPRHPLRKAEANMLLLRDALAGLIGVSDPGNLRALEAELRAMPVPARDKVAMIDAVHALLSTHAVLPGEDLVIVRRVELERAAARAESDGDEHGIGQHLRALLGAAATSKVR
ncbi:hypothetical protein ABWU93_11655 [Xanthomonas translucens pv. translucens]|uniref:hypothetical protein n=1 Tax=Xanthomonas campestris pv. translucens TaxID=343 RepID=UPI003F7289B6